MAVQQTAIDANMPTVGGGGRIQVIRRSFEDCLLINFSCSRCDCELLLSLSLDQFGHPFDCANAPECPAQYVVCKPKYEAVWRVESYPLPDDMAGPGHVHNVGVAGCWCGARSETKVP